MRTKLLIFLLIAFLSFNASAQFVWYDVDAGLSEVTIAPNATECNVCTFTPSIANPVSGDEATNVSLWNIESNSPLEFKKLNIALDEGILATELPSLIVSVRIYFPEYDFIQSWDSARRFRLYIPGINYYKQLNLLESNEGNWHTLEFDFSSPQGSGTPPDVISDLELRVIYGPAQYTNLDNDLNFYIDTITSTVDQSQNLSIDDNKFETRSLKILSNPVTNNTLELSEQIQSAVVYDITGKILKRFNTASEFDVSSLSSGIYLLRADLGEGISKTVRFIKE